MALIHEKLARVSSKINAVGKNSLNKDDGYKFRSIYDIYNQLQPVFKSEGIYFTPKILESSEFTVSTNKGRAFRVKLKVEWTIYCEDGSSITAIMLGEGLDPGDKASNKAMTASLKYLLIYMFLIPTVPYETDADFNSLGVLPFEEFSPQVGSKDVQVGSKDVQVGSKGVTPAMSKTVPGVVAANTHIEQKKSILALAESKGISRLELAEIGLQLGFDIDKELSKEQRKLLFDKLQSL